MKSREGKVYGAVLGSCGALSAGYGASWSGLGDGGIHVWIIALVASVLLGAFSWGPLQNPEDTNRPHWVYAGLFGASAGLIAGAFAAYPFGALFGAPGGAVGAAVSCSLLNRSSQPVEGRTAAGIAVFGGVLGLVFVMGVSP